MRRINWPWVFLILYCLLFWLAIITGVLLLLR